MLRKISISGTFSSGKTTLCNAIYHRVPDITLIIEHASDVRLVLPNISWSSAVVRDYLLFSQLVRETRAAYKHHDGIAVCDTGILEAIAHSRIFGVNPHLDLLDELQHARYDAVFICDYEGVPIVDNGIRHLDTQLRIRLQGEIIQVAMDLKYRPIVVTGDVECRLKTICSWLGVPLLARFDGENSIIE